MSTIYIASSTFKPITFISLEMFFCFKLEVEEVDVFSFFSSDLVLSKSKFAISIFSLVLPTCTCTLLFFTCPIIIPFWFKFVSITFVPFDKSEEVSVPLFIFSLSKLFKSRIELFKSFLRLFKSFIVFVEFEEKE